MQHYMHLLTISEAVMRYKIPKPVKAWISGQRQLRKTLKSVLPMMTPDFVRPTPKRAARPVLREILDFGTNPGRLRMLEYVPKTHTSPKTLVVVIHGCLQTATEYHNGSGWARLAREKGIVLVYPEQTRQNNPNLCFNWFRPSAVARDRGEVGSIRQMIDNAVRRHKVPKDRVFIHGLSAGAAIASALLVAYPDLFRAGQLVAGMPYGGARDGMTALRVMKSGVEKSPRELGDLVRLARDGDLAKHPAISIWQGQADRVVNPANGIASLRQWLDVLGLAEDDGRIRESRHAKTTTWMDSKGYTVLDYHAVDGFDHGLPVRSTVASRGKTFPYMLEGAISAPHKFYDDFIRPS